MYYKAKLAEFSYKFYEKMLKKAFLDPNIELTYNKKILIYCFLHKAISFRQISMIFGDSYKKQMTMNMILHRMVKNGVVEKLSFGKSNEKAYFITALGIKECKMLLMVILKEHMANEKLSMDYYVFELEDIIEYLSKRCTNIKPAYWRHNLATRDIFVHLLGAAYANQDFEFESEVAIDEYGTLSSLYTRSLYGLNLKYQIRSDGLLTYKASEGPHTLDFLVEVDNCTQSSSVIRDKVKRYIDNYILTYEFRPQTSLMFCINTAFSISNTQKKRYTKFSTRDYYFAFALTVCYELMVNMGVKLEPNMKIESIITLLEDCNKDNNNERINRLIKYFREKNLMFKEDMLINNLYQTYNDSKEKRQFDIKEESDIEQQKKYITRRALIHRAIADLPSLKEAFLKGFSLYTVGNYNLTKTFPYINCEVIDKSVNFLEYLKEYNIININDRYIYKYCFNIDSNNYVIKNYYDFTDKKIGIVVENISDDLGGYLRVLKFLSSYTVPSDIVQERVLVCVCDNHFIENLNAKDLYIIDFINLCIEQMKKGLEVLFLPYDNISVERLLLTFSPSGKVIYKEKLYTKG